MDKLMNLIWLSMFLAFGMGLALHAFAAKSAGVTVIEYVIFFLGCAAIVLLVVFRKRREAIIQAASDNYGFVVMFLAAGIVVNAALVYLGASGLLFVTLFTFLSGLVVLMYKWFWEGHLNVFSVFVAAVVGAWIGTTAQLNIVIYLFVGFCVYDLIAVFRTKFMKNLILRVLRAKTIPPLFLTDMDLRAVRQRIQGNTDPKTKIKGHLWGGGDIVLGSMFPVAVAISHGTPYGLYVLIGGLAGIWLNFYIVDRRRVGLPALPLIFSCEAGFFLFTLTLNPLFILGCSVMGFLLIDRMAMWKARKTEAFRANVPSSS